MKKLEPLPPRWPGIAMILAGILGLVFMVSPRAAAVALGIVVLTACILGALTALAAIIAAGEADQKMGRTQDEISESGRRYAEECMRQIREDESRSK